MKYIVLLCDGMADEPVGALGGKTPMQIADKPRMDALAEKATVGMVKTVPDDLSPGSDVANLSVMGYPPAAFYTGRSPLEAASMGIALKAEDLAFRCNLVTLSEDEPFSEKTMVDYCAGDISTQEARVLIEDLHSRFGCDAWELYSGISYRHCLVRHNSDGAGEEYTPPHDISGRSIGPYLPKGGQSAQLLAFMEQSYAFLSTHPVNLARVQSGKRPANAAWLWGFGKKPALTSFEERFSLRGAVVSAVDLVKGIGVCAQMQICPVDGATGYLDTNFEGKTDAALQALRQGCDYVYLHFEAPDECGHRGEAANKVRSIEEIDRRVLGRLIHGLEAMGDYKLLILPDHPTPLSSRTHSRTPVPFLLYHKNAPVRSGISCFCEQQAEQAGLYYPDCDLLVRAFLETKRKD